MCSRSKAKLSKSSKPPNANAHVVGNTAQKAKKTYATDATRHSMLDMSQPISLTFVFSTVGAIFVVIGVCVYLVNQKTKMLKDKQ